MVDDDFPTVPSPEQPWQVPHQTILQWLADAGRYQWLKKHFTATVPVVTGKTSACHPTWHLPTALLLRFRAPDLDQAD